MKKLAACLLVFIMLMSNMAYAANYYEEWGDMPDWTPEQWEYAETEWTDEDWDEYYEAWDAAWEAIYAEKEAEWLLEYQAEIGMSNIGGANININGSFLDFGELLPVYVNGRTMVPLSVIATPLGLSIEHEGNIVKASGTHAETVLVLGDMNIQSIRNGKTSMVESDAAPYVDAASGEIYVPVRQFTEALCYDFFWFEQIKAMYIVDRIGLVSDIDRNFKTVNKLLAASAPQNIDDTYEYGVKAELKGTLYGDTKDDVVKVNLEMDALVKGFSAAVSGKLSVDVKDIADVFFKEIYEQEKDIFKELENTSFDIIVNSDRGSIYLKSPMLKHIDDTIAAGTWIASEFDEEMLSMYQSYGDSSLTVGSLIYDSVWGDSDYTYYYYYDLSDTYKELKEAAAIMNIVMGDSAFKASTSAGVTTYTLKMDNKSFMTRALLYGGDLLSEMDDYLLAEFLPEFNYTFQFKEKDGEVTYIRADGAIKNLSLPYYRYYMPTIPIEYTFHIEGSPGKASGEIALKGRYVGKLELNINTVAKISGKTVPEGPPEGERIEYR